MIFTPVRTEGDAGYADTTRQMLEPAYGQPGFPGLETTWQEIGISLSHRASPEAVQHRKQNAKHREAQKRA